MAESSQSPFDALLEQSGDLFDDRVSEAVSEMLGKSEESLNAMMSETQNTAMQELYRKTRDNLLAKRQDFEKDFRNRVSKEFKSRANKVKKVSQSLSDIDLSSLELELVGEDDLTATLKFNEMAAKARRFCDEELSALDQRMGVLLGDADLQSDDNPLSPQVISEAYKHACKHVETEAAAIPVMLKLFDDHVIDHLRSVYKEINALLVKNSILPKIRYSVTKKEGGKSPAGAAGSDEDEAPAEKAPPPSEQDFFAMMQNLMKATAGGGGGGGGGIPGVPGGQVVVLQGAELLSSLTRLQQGGGGAPGEGGGGADGLPVIQVGGGTTNVLRELKDSSVGSSMAQMDAMTLDIVAMIFDQIFDEPKIPLSVKGLVGRMQIPMLKVAIADKAFFSDKKHPARKMLDTLGEIAVRLPADFSSSSPLFGEMEKIVEELMAGFKDNVEIFDTSREKFQALIASEDARQSKETEVAAKRLKEQEDLALAKAVSQNEIRERLKGKAGKVPRFVVDFLIQHWIKFMLLVHVKRGKDSDAWKASLQTMDELIWSVEPKEKLEDRKKLATMVPPMLKRMTACLNGAGVDKTVVSRFFDDLMKLHTEIVGKEEEPAKAAPSAPAAAGAPAAASAAPAKGAPAAAPAAPPKAPAKPVELDLDFTAEVVVKNPFGGGDVAVQQLDFTDLPSASPTQARAVAKDAQLTDHLMVGAWIEVKQKGENDTVTARPARCSFVSPMKTSYIFVDRNGTTVLECSRAELARRYRLKEVVDIDEAPLFDRIMTGLVGKMKAGAPAKA
jgi:uncharacterized protein DUF1631